jgi:hypothetical protein
MLIVNFNPQEKSFFWTKKSEKKLSHFGPLTLATSFFGIHVTFKSKDTHQMPYLSFYDLSLQ